MPHEKYCKDCDTTKSTDAYYEFSQKKPDGTRRKFLDNICRECRKVRNRKNSKNWRRQNPEKVRAQTKRRWERIKSDPERYAHERELHRIYYRLRREKETGTLDLPRQRARVSTRERDPRLPVNPLRDWIRRQLSGQSVEDLALTLGVDARTIRRILFDTQKVEMSCVDRLLIRTPYSLHDLYEVGA